MPHRAKSQGKQMTGFGILLMVEGLIGGRTIGINDAMGGGSGLIGWIIAGGGAVGGILMIVFGARKK